MNLNEYQERARSTAIYPGKFNVIYPAFKLCGEAGEVAEKIGKCLRDHNGVFNDERRDQIKKELGDVLWYIANLAFDFDFTLEDIAQTNLDKLASRKERNKIQGSGDER